MNLPLRFEVNAGNKNRQHEYVGRGLGYELGLSSRGVDFKVRGHRVAMEFVRPIQTPLRLEPEEPLGAKTNYFLGNKREDWRTDLANYGRIRYRDVWKNIDLVLYGNQRQFEYDLVVSPGADLQQIELRFDGATRVDVDAEGNLLLDLGDGTLRQRRPVVVQQGGGKVQAEYVKLAGNRVGFRVIGHDPAKTLTIDPIIDYSTYLGGASSDIAYGIALDSTGAAYLTGITNSPGLATSGALSSSIATGDSQCFVMKIDPTGTRVVYTTYYGGNGEDIAWSIAVDGQGQAHIVGMTDSTDLPRKALGVNDPWMNLPRGANLEAFIAKLSPGGNNLIYSTYIGGAGFDIAFQVATDGNSVYVVGQTGSAQNFPIFRPFQRLFSGDTDGFLMKLDSLGNRLYVTYLGGEDDDVGYAVSFDPLGRAYVSGVTLSSAFARAPVRDLGGALGDLFVLRMTADGQNTDYVKFVNGWAQGGAAGEPPRQEPFRVAVDSTYSAWVAGWTTATDFCSTFRNGFQRNYGGGLADGFLLRLDSSGERGSCTFLGGRGGDYALALALDQTNSAVFVGGRTSSTNFPILPGALQSTYTGGAWDGFLSKFSIDGSRLLESTYLGGGLSDEIFDMALGKNGTVYLTGSTESLDFPLSPIALQRTRPGVQSIFLSKIDDPGVCRLSVTLAGSGVAEATVSAEGVSNVINVQTSQTGCTWNPLAADPDWVRIDPSAGAGSASFRFTVARNDTGRARASVITVGGRTVRIFQFAAGCNLSLFPSRLAVGANGEDRSVLVSAPLTQGCSWQLAAPPEWVRVAKGSGTGPGVLSFSVDPNPGPTRTAELALGSEKLRIVQNGAACSISFGSSSGPVGQLGGGGAIDVLASSPDCDWEASTTDSFIRILDRTGSGSGRVRFQVASMGGTRTSSTAPRYGTIKVNGRSFRIAQLNSILDSREISLSSGTAADKGKAAFGGRRFIEGVCQVSSITQDGKAITEVVYPSDGGPVKVTVNYRGSCKVSPSWNDGDGFDVSPLQFDGSGPATFTVTAKPNTSSVGSGTSMFFLLFGAKSDSKSISVRRTGKTCRVSFVPRSIEQEASPDKISGVIDVQSDPSDCEWKIDTTDSFLDFPNGSKGRGPGQIAYVLSQNTGVSQRTTRLRLNDTEEIPLVQKGATPQPCSLTFSKSSFTATADLRTLSVSVTASSDTCAWTAAASDFIDFPDGPNGTGNGSFRFSVKENRGAARSGKVTIAGVLGNPNSDALTIVQAAPVANACQYLLVASAGTVPAAGGTGSFEIQTDSTCAWTALSDSSWLQITSATSGSGKVTVAYKADANSGPERTGRISVGTRSFTLTQSAAGSTPFSLRLDPNPIQVCDGSGLGKARVVWSVPSASAVEVRFPDGTVWAKGGSSGSAETDKWIGEGLEFVLFNVSATPAVRLGSVVASLTTSGCGGTSSRSGRLTVTPNPIQVCTVGGPAPATLSWTTVGVSSVEIRRGRPDGPLLVSGGASGSNTTPQTLTDGLVLYLQDVSDSRPLTAENSLDQITIRFTQDGCQASGPPTITADPNPIQICEAGALGRTTIRWSAPGIARVQVRFSSGQVWTSGGPVGSAVTGDWVGDGMVFELWDGDRLQRLTSVTVRHTRAGCSVASATGVLLATPNPIQVCDGSGIGSTGLQFSALNATRTELHRNLPNGPLLASGTPDGNFFTPKDVRDGTIFLLQNVSGGLPLTDANTMARVTVGITTSGCTAVIPGILPPANLVTPDNGGNDWYYEFLLNGVNALGSGAVVRETVGFAVESDTVGNETRYIYPSPFWTSRPIYDLRSFSSIRFSMAAIQLSTGRGTSLATGSPYIVLQSSNGSRTITKDSPPPTSMDFQVLSVPILASGSGWTVTTDGDFQPAAVTSIRFGLRTVNPGFASGLANIQFVR